VEIVIDTSGELADTEPAAQGEGRAAGRRNPSSRCAPTAPEVEIDHLVAASLSAQAGTRAAAPRIPEAR
jgi:hypothetical protein